MRAKDDRRGDKIVYYFDRLGLSAWIYHDPNIKKQWYHVYFMNKSVMKTPIKFEYMEHPTDIKRAPSTMPGKSLLLFAIFSVAQDVNNGKMTYLEFCEEFEFVPSKEAYSLWKRLVNDRKRMAKIVDVDELVDDVLQGGLRIG